MMTNDNEKKMKNGAKDPKVARISRKFLRIFFDMQIIISEIFGTFRQVSGAFGCFTAGFSEGLKKT